MQVNILAVGGHVNVKLDLFNNVTKSDVKKQQVLIRRHLKKKLI